MEGSRESRGWIGRSTKVGGGESELGLASGGGPRNLCCGMMGLGGVFGRWIGVL